jgi:hypothetical protein
MRVYSTRSSISIVIMNCIRSVLVSTTHNKLLLLLLTISRSNLYYIGTPVHKISQQK